MTGFQNQKPAIDRIKRAMIAYFAGNERVRACIKRNGNIIRA